MREKEKYDIRRVDVLDIRIDDLKVGIVMILGRGLAAITTVNKLSCQYYAHDSSTLMTYTESPSSINSKSSSLGSSSSCLQKKNKKSRKTKVRSAYISSSCVASWSTYVSAIFLVKMNSEQNVDRY